MRTLWKKNWTKMYSAFAPSHLSPLSLKSYLIHDSVCNPGPDPTPPSEPKHPTLTSAPPHLPAISAWAQSLAALLLLFHLKLVGPAPDPAPIMCHPRSAAMVWIKGKLSGSHQSEHKKDPLTREACLDDMTPASQPTVECKSNASVACLCTQRVRCLPGKEENTNIYYIYCMDIWKNNALLDKQICSFCLE